MKFGVVICDPPWRFDDRLKMSAVKRGAESQYNGTMSVDEIALLPVPSLLTSAATVALWVPSSHIESGIRVLKHWGVTPKSTYVWVKTKKKPFKNLLKDVKKIFVGTKLLPLSNVYYSLKLILDKFTLNEALSFNMGHFFRQTHEIAIIGRTKGAGISKMLKNRSQRSVHMSAGLKHSQKPDSLHVSLELMLPDVNKLELFARRDRVGWTCIGNECPATMNEDIKKSLAKLQRM